MRSVPQQNLMLKILQDKVRELKGQLNNSQMKTDSQEHQIKLLKEKFEEQQKVTDFTRSIFAEASKIADLVPDSPPLPDEDDMMYIQFQSFKRSSWRIDNTQASKPLF